jgi:hypothetical protein
MPILKIKKNGIWLEIPVLRGPQGPEGPEGPVGPAGASGRNITHQRDITASGSSQSVTFGADTAGSAFIVIPSSLNINDMTLAITCNNLSENYIWVENNTNADVDVLIGGIEHMNDTIVNAYLPDSGITVPSGKTCEIGLVVNQAGNGDYRAIVTFVNYLVGSSQQQ